MRGVVRDHLKTQSPGVEFSFRATMDGKRSKNNSWNDALSIQPFSVLPIPHPSGAISMQFFGERTYV